jgi:murein DD-endopeptidase MepM/ murein hydrolase activator NlpD
MPRTNGRYTILFVPDNNGKTFSVRLHKNLLFFLIVIIVIFLFGLGVLLFGAGEIATKLQLASFLKTENEHLKERNHKLQKSLEQVEKIERLTKYLQRLALAAGEDAADLALQKETKKTDENVFAKDSIDNDIEHMRFFRQNEEAPAKSDSLPENIAAAIPNIRPVDGWITQRFDSSAGPASAHGGIDFAATRGSPIMSSAPGVVSEIVFDRYLGLLISVNHGFGYVTKYGHCLIVLVKKGDSVKRGQTIALVGNTGFSSAPHLHYEVHKDGRPLDPLQYFFNAQN